MNESPKALRLHIGLFGRRNAGKSSLLNALVGQDVAIVSPTPGSTADPVEKTLEMAPLGPVVFLDTAGLDDRDASLGVQRVERSLRAMRRVDVALLVLDAPCWEAVDADTAARLAVAASPLPWWSTAAGRRTPVMPHGVLTALPRRSPCSGPRPGKAGDWKASGRRWPVWLRPGP